MIKWIKNKLTLFTKYCIVEAEKADNCNNPIVKDCICYKCQKLNAENCGSTKFLPGGCFVFENKLKNPELIVRFKNDTIMELFLIQMMDGFGEPHCDFTHCHKSDDGEFIKKYDDLGRLICTGE